MEDYRGEQEAEYDRYTLTCKVFARQPKGINYGCPDGYTSTRIARQPEGHKLRCAWIGITL